MRKKNNKKFNFSNPFKLNKGKTSTKGKKFFTFGKLGESRGRILALVATIIFLVSYLLLGQIRSYSHPNRQITTPVQIKQKSPLERQITSLVKGYPIEKMAPIIAQQDPQVAAFIIGIAKKESNWGKRKPVLAGNDCYNYWGFRMKAEKMGSGGHTCFSSPQEAVKVIASRIDEMVNEENIDTPKKMVVWKCGYGCQDQPKSNSERKWISDVNLYYSEFQDYL